MFKIMAVTKSGKCLAIPLTFTELKEAKEELKKQNNREWIASSGEIYPKKAIDYFFIKTT